MALPTSGNLSILDVRSEQGQLTSPYSLVDCFNNAQAGGFNLTYGNINDTNLRAFLGYSHTTMTAITNVGYSGASSAGACPSGANTYYGETNSLTTTTHLYTTAAGTTYATTGYYAQSGFWKFWNSGSGTFTSSGFCI